MQVAAARVAIDGCQKAVSIENCLHVEDEISQVDRIHAYVIDQGKGLQVGAVIAQGGKERFAHFPQSLLLCLVAAVLGTVLGVLLTRVVMLAPVVSAFLVPDYPLSIFVRAVAVAVGVAVAGALFPAFRAVRLSPMEALRHE